jgi:hypothetical protein
VFWYDEDERKVADMIDIMEVYHKFVPVKPDTSCLYMLTVSVVKEGIMSRVPE